MAKTQGYPCGSSVVLLNLLVKSKGSQSKLPCMPLSPSFPLFQIAVVVLWTGLNLTSQIQRTIFFTEKNSLL